MMTRLIWLLPIIAFLNSPTNGLNVQQNNWKFKLFCRDECEDTLGLNVRYYMVALGDTVKFRVNPQTGICYLPSKGIYKLYTMEFEYPLTYSFDGQEKDTLNFPQLYFGVSTAADVGYSSFMKCNTVANGKIVDWFKPEKKRCDGRFKNGKLIGKLTFYDLNGDVAKTEIDPRIKRK